MGFWETASDKKGIDILWKFFIIKCIELNEFRSTFDKGIKVILIIIRTRRLR